MNRTPLARRTQIINCLVEGNSIRSTERMTNTHRDTVMRLAVEVGQGCERIMDEKMRGLTSKRLQVDEIWSYVGKHQRYLKPTDDRTKIGDMWTFVALDADTKLVPAYHIGKRTKAHATLFMTDLSERLSNRVQITSDGLNSYIDAVDAAFGVDVDFGQSVKFYEAEPIGPGRYAPPKVVRAERHVVEGKPDQKHISTSLVERQNLTMRMGMRRFTRLTNAFSKKAENHRAAVGLHFAHYNFVRQHKSIRMTPAMAAGMESSMWTLEELVDRTSR
jgi:IS1 family transposase